MRNVFITFKIKAQNEKCVCNILKLRRNVVNLGM